jgi:hypothetical protein
MESGKKKRVHLAIDSFDSLFSDDAKSDGDSAKSLSISELLERKAQERKTKQKSKRKQSANLLRSKMSVPSTKSKDNKFFLKRALSGKQQPQKAKYLDFSKRARK